MDDGRWSRLIEEHQREAVVRRELEQLDPARWWGVLAGVLLPWSMVAIAWVAPSSALSLLLCCAVLLPVASLVGLAVERWRPIGVGLLVGSFGVLVIAPTLFVVTGWEPW